MIKTMAGAEQFNELPEDCISTILSLTSPKDTISFSLVSSFLQSVTASDFIWETFLPSDYNQIIDKSVTPLNYSSKKELFVRLCNSSLLDGGNNSFALEKSSGKTSYIISAEELSILHGEEPDHWTWKSVLKVAELKVIKLWTSILSAKTKYGICLIMKISDGALGLSSVPVEISLEIGNRKEVHMVFLDHRNSERELLPERLPCKRGDGWMEIELGELFNGGYDDDDEEEVREFKGGEGMPYKRWTCY
ncbi:F-box protein PP2-B15-like [Capsicum chacoense]